MPESAVAIKQIETRALIIATVGELPLILLTQKRARSAAPMQVNTIGTVIFIISV